MSKHKQARSKPVPIQGPASVNISVMEDGTVTLVFTQPVTQFNASAEEMAQLGMNLIKASQVAQQQRELYAGHAAAPVPARKM